MGEIEYARENATDVEVEAVPHQADDGPRSLQLIGDTTVTAAQVGEMAGLHIAQGVEVAKRLSDIISKQGLSVQIRGSGDKPYVKYEGWSTLARLVGLDIVIAECHYEEQGDGTYGFRATAELHDRNGTCVSRATSGCYSDERWAKRDRYTMESMAQTRAAGKACRMKLSWIMQLAGYEPTPVEEMSFSGSPPATQTPSRSPAEPDFRAKLLGDLEKVIADHSYRPAWLKKPIMFGEMKESGHIWEDGIGPDSERTKRVRSWIHRCIGGQLTDLKRNGQNPDDWSLEGCPWAIHNIAGKIVLMIHAWEMAADAAAKKKS